MPQLVMKFPLHEAAVLEQALKGIVQTTEALRSLNVPLDQYGPHLVPKIENTQKALSALREAIAA